MVWAKGETPGGSPAIHGTDYVNLAVVNDLHVEDVSGGAGTDWRIACSVAQAGHLAGSWATEAAAADVLRKLVDGVDPSTY